ncbi:MAG TPA: biotin transporter BioY [Candidatus Dormibacteraeota bacterium]|nr:biotin transporter BioY [Candidatus Dormibacteraeota bacterium]
MTISVPSLERLDRLPAAERGLTIADFLVPIRIGERMSSRLRHILLIAAGALLIAVCAQITIIQQGQTVPLIADFRIRLADSPVPITGQTFAVLLTGGALGFRRGVLAVLLYLVAGLFLPVYAAGHSGLATIIGRGDGGIVLGTTGGYLLGFILAAAVTGRLAELGWDRHLGGATAAMLIGNVLVYVIGVPWLAAALPASVTAGHPLETAIALGLTPFVIFDLVKLLLAAGSFPFAWWVVGRRPDER